jgi:hypothetical protein
LKGGDGTLCIDRLPQFHGRREQYCERASSLNIPLSALVSGC